MRNTLEERRWVAVQIAWKYQGTPYLWGGDDPMEGFDCSGLVVEVLKSVGLLPRRGDWTAAGLYEIFKDREVGPSDRGPGCLVFRYDRTGRIVHVEILITADLTIGASGGSSKTLGLEGARKTNAFVKVRPIAHLSEIYAFVDPFMEVKADG